MSVTTDTSSTARISEIPVLISGAGPTGLFAAFLFGRMGVPYRIIERDLDSSVLSKSLWIHARTMEILQMSDPELIQQVLDQGVPAATHRFYYGGKFVRELDLVPRCNSHFNTHIHLKQSQTVRILSDAIVKQGGKVEWGWELVDTHVVDTKVVEATVDGSYTSEKSWVETTIRRALHGTNSRTGENKVLGTVDLDEEDKEKEYEYETIRSQFLIGADGARSVVRHKFDIPFPGRTRDIYMMAFDGIVEANISLDSINWLYNSSKVAVIPLGGNHVQIVGMTGTLTPEEFEAKKNETLTVEDFQKYLDEGVHPQKLTVKSVNWLTYYRVNERRAQEFSYKGRVFLAGDAAHIHSPAAGQGLNLGLQDSYSLAWRIAMVVRGTAPISILDTYGEERAPIADQVIEMTAATLDDDFLLGTTIQRAMKRVIVALAPIIRPLLSIKIAPVAMMDQHYHENSLNRSHKTQHTPTGQGAVGRRAGDAPLVPLCGNNDISHSDSPDLSLIENLETSTETTKLKTTRLHELIAHPGIFQVVVFTGNLWKSDPEAVTRLSETVGKYLGMWRSKWCPVNNWDDGKAAGLKRVIMVHTITTLSASSTPNALAEKELGEGKAYVDPKGKLHSRYSVDAAVKKGQELGGAIVVVRPDSHVAYRVQGVGDSAWNDVNEYFESILA